MGESEEINLATLAAHFSDPLAAAEYLESVRWPDGPACPHCGEFKREPYRLNVKNSKRRIWKCRACRKQFTVTVGTIFEGSHIPLNKWLLAFYLLCASKKGVSSHQLHRMLGITYKSAWFMTHRIREAMTDPGFAEKMTGTVEVDETYVGGKARGKRGRGAANKTPVVSLVERGGEVRSRVVPNVTASSLKNAIREHVDSRANITTDGLYSYRGLDSEFASHEIVEHSQGEYVRGNAHTNTVEGYFANLKRGLTGVYHHVSQEHLHRYLREFDFRYNTRGLSDGTRTLEALRLTAGRRLMYSDSR